MSQNQSTSGRILGFVAVILMALFTITAIVTRYWVLTALPVGILFGFFLQKGDLCGASAMSEVIAFRDGRKLFGVWICIVVSMLVFAAGDVLNLVTLNPKPMLWLNFIIGGAIFGVGTVLAGGCVSGCLFKGVTGNINSIVALIAMPVGIALVEFGPLNSLFLKMKTAAVTGPDGQVLDLPMLTGIPFWILALIFGTTTLGFVIQRRRHSKVRSVPKDKGPLMRRLLMRPWKPWQAGVAIGLLALPAYMSSAASGRNYPLGVTHGVLQLQVLVTETEINHVYQKPSDEMPVLPPATPQSQQKKVVWWLVLLVLGLLGGALTSGRLSGQARLKPKPPEQTLVAILGGFLVGVGAALATGCVIGNIMSGWALMSVGMFLFGAATLLGNWIMTHFYLMGGSPGRT